MTKDAKEIYDNWPRMSKENGEISKSAKISKLIVEQNDIHLRMNAMKKQINQKNIQIARVIWELRGNPIHNSLCTDLNDLLLGTIHYQYE
ncbi:unnamed protein product [marine sediment metagenome]|uniref:Uncharacterized protein n=1 Tax=marine sediment metagenome TaxID=412755 RepID=X1J8Z0_9ZZZZ